MSQWKKPSLEFSKKTNLFKAFSRHVSVPTIYYQTMQYVVRQFEKIM